MKSKQDAMQQHRIEIDPEREQVAVVKMKYRPGMSFFRKDLGLSLVSAGRANVASGMHIDIPSMPTVDGSTQLGDIEADVKYLEDLSKAEYEAVKDRKGMWNVDAIRKTRLDLVEEMEFERNASVWKKLWRKFKEGDIGPLFWRKK
jgi:endonuclease YncB( thermonuclease family)